MSLALETLRSDETLDLGGLGVGLGTLLLGLYFTADNELADLAREELISDCGFIILGRWKVVDY